MQTLKLVSYFALYSGQTSSVEKIKTVESCVQKQMDFRSFVSHPKLECWQRDSTSR